MRRPGTDEALMATAYIWAKRATCARLQVGAVVSKDTRIISIGYNGAASGLPHCLHTDDQPCTVSVHAESNAIVYAARRGISTEGAEMHITHAPCLDCAKLIISAGIKKVTYSEFYRSTSGIDLLVAAGVAHERLG